MGEGKFREPVFHILHQFWKQTLKIYKIKIMNEQNVEYLKNNIKYLGFSDSVFPELMKNIENRFPEFTLTHSRDYGTEKLEAKLHFSKSQTSDMYFANNYLATLTKANQEKVSQMIYLEKGNGLTQKESYNLLSGRSVNTDLKNREGEKYNAWIKLDFSVKEPNGNYKLNQFHEAYKYDLTATLQKYHINELKDDTQKERLIQSLQRGNKQQVSFEKNGVAENLLPRRLTWRIFVATGRVQFHHRGGLRQGDERTEAGQADEVGKSMERAHGGIPEEVSKGAGGRQRISGRCAA